MKIFFRRIHLYLGLASGIVITIVCFTGALLVFEKEAQQLIYPKRYFVEEGATRKSLDELKSNLVSEIEGASVTGARIIHESNRSVELSYHPEAKENKGERGGNQIAFMNPYTGELIELYNHRNSFFYTIFALHRWLLADNVGKLITGIATSIFLFIIITGIILWWPKNVQFLKSRLKLNFKGSFKKVNHDWHIILGFYTSIFLFAFAFTGLAWSFQWFNDAIYWVTNSENKRPEPPSSIYAEGFNTISLEDVFQKARLESPASDYYNINIPKDSAGVYSVSILEPTASHERASDQLHIDQYSGEVIAKQRYEERSLGQRVRSVFYMIHTGAIGGVPGKIIAFVVCILGATFPTTGTIMWINRIRLKKKRQELQPELV